MYTRNSTTGVRPKNRKLVKIGLSNIKTDAHGESEKLLIVPEGSPIAQ